MLGCLRDNARLGRAHGLVRWLVDWLLGRSRRSAGVGEGEGGGGAGCCAALSEGVEDGIDILKGLVDVCALLGTYNNASATTHILLDGGVQGKLCAHGIKMSCGAQGKHCARSCVLCLLAQRCVCSSVNPDLALIT